MKSYLTTLFCILLSVQLSYCSLYGLWAIGDTAVFGQVSNITGSLLTKLEFPSYTPYFGLGAENNLTQVYTFVLQYPGNTLYLVTVNVAKNKVIFFTPIPSGLYPLGLKYDSDVNSLKATISGGNSTWLVTEFDPSSASYDVYLTISDATFLSAGLSTYNHTYYVAFQSAKLELYSFDTRSGDLINTQDLVLQEGVLEGPLDMLYIPALDILVGSFLVQDNSNNVGQDYGIIDVTTGIVKMLGIYQPSQQASIVSHAAHEYYLYAVVNINDALQLVTIDINQQSQSSQVAEATLLTSLGFFSGI